MKKLLFFFVILFSSFQLSAQSVGINNNGTPPDSSAILDIKSNNKGVLLPRIFLTGLYDSLTIPKPAISLLVFNINTNLPPGGAGYYAWNGKSWDLILSTSNVFIEGKNKFVTEVDGDARQYIVHVPESYSNAIQTPVVFILHGTAQTGENMYDKSGWKEVGEDENILAVFPTSWRYCIDNQGTIAPNTTKWNTPRIANGCFVQDQRKRREMILSF